MFLKENIIINISKFICTIYQYNTLINVCKLLYLLHFILYLNLSETSIKYKIMK